MAVTANVIDGSLLLLKVGGVTIGKATSHSYSVSHNVRDITNKDSSAWEESLGGRRSWEVSGDGLYTFDETYNFEDLHDLIENRTKVELLMMRTDPKNVGDTYYKGYAYLTSLNVDAPADDNVTYSYTFKGTGEPTPIAIT